MNSMGKIGLAALFASVLATGVTAFVRMSQDGAPPPVPADVMQRSVRLLLAQRFTLDEAYVHWWRKEQPRVAAGWLLVLEVDKDLVYPRQMKEPVLYAGRETAERVNFGHESGRVIALVPGDVDLARAPLFFGQAALPEEVDAAWIEAELAAALRAGATPPSQAEIEAAQIEPLHLADQYNLFLRAADLIEEHSPQEADLVSGLRAPRIDRR
ncbi:MAG: hypothetical protein HY812_21260 [Planctomycetes bacterium]|nr:hypothetical protein [Planctomycetota bacterium]